MKPPTPKTASRFGFALAGLLAAGSAFAQATPSLLAYWDFNNASNPNQTLDKIYAFAGALEAGAAFTPDAGGRTATTGDRAMDFGYDSSKQLVRIGKVPFLNVAAAQDQITIVFWEQLYEVANMSAFWGASPSSNNGERGIQAHVPWSDSNIYFDTAGCCDAGTQRINKVVDTSWPGYVDTSYWYTWRHLAFVKDGATKRIYIDGQLFLEGSNTAPLPVDFYQLSLGAQTTGDNSMRGIMDDFAVFAGALSADQVTQLAGGTAPDKLTGITVSTDPLVGGANGTPTGFTLEITDSQTKQVNKDTVTVKFDGADVSPVITKSGTATTIVYTQPSGFLASGSTHEVAIAFKDTAGADYSATRPFKVVDYVLVPDSFALPDGAVDKTKPGFLIHPYQTEAAQPNTLQWTEEQLAGLHGANIADLTGADANGYYPVETIVNFNVDAPNMVGNFTTDTGYTDELFPGFPGTTGSTGNATEEVLTYLEFPAAGTYIMGVNSDDGFRVATARNAKDKLGVILGQFDGGRGSADTLFTFYIQKAGVYPFRLIWENGNGEFSAGNAANLEWFTVDATGTKIPVNDSSKANAIKAYRASSFTAAYVVSATPGANATGVAPDVDIVVEVADGSTAINPSTIAMTVNAQPVTPTVSKTGSTTKLTVASTSMFASGSTNQVTLAFKDQATPTPIAYDYAWQFMVFSYVTLTTDLWSDLNSTDKTKPGFNVRIHQVDPGDTILGTGGETSGEAQGRYTANIIESAEAQLAGLYGPNVADLTLAVNGVFAVPTVINYDVTSSANGNFNANAAPPYDIPDELVPGIPGLSANPTAAVAGEFLTYVEFPTAGYYQMGVNSDDDFRVSEEETLARQYCVVEAPAAAAGPIASVPAVYALQGQFGGPMPINPPLVADAILADPIQGCDDLANAAALKGKIALIDRGTCGFVVKARKAQEAGAAAVIIMNSMLQYPFTMGADPLGPDLTIPSLMISQADGNKLKANINGLRISLGSDPATRLGEFNQNGRGASDTIFGFVVPKAGVYPLRCVWQQGNGGGNVEWFTVAKDGTKTLLNDSKAGALKGYRARTFVAAPIIGIAKSAGNVVITYTGTLQAADAVTGPWSDVAGSSPQTIPATAAQKFYRAKR